MRKIDTAIVICVEHECEPALWEKGGLLGDSGYALVIADKLGKPKPVLMRGDIRCGKHGLFFVEDGDYIIEATYEEHRKPPVIVKVFQVIETLYHYEEGYPFARAALIARRRHKLRGTIPDCLTSAVKAAEEKMMCRLCDHIHYGCKDEQIATKPRRCEMRPTVSRIEKGRVPNDWDLSDSDRYETIVQNGTVTVKRDMEFTKKRIQDSEGCHEYEASYFLLVSGFRIAGIFNQNYWEKPGWFEPIIYALERQLEKTERGFKVLAEMKRDLEEAIAVLEARLDARQERGSHEQMSSEMQRIENDRWRVRDSQYKSIINNGTVWLKLDTEYVKEQIEKYGVHERDEYFLYVKEFDIDALMNCYYCDTIGSVGAIIDDLIDQLEKVENGLEVLPKRKRDIEEAIAELKAKQEEAGKEKPVEVRDEQGDNLPSGQD
jgi:prefoldin subunit 5